MVQLHAVRLYPTGWARHVEPDKDPRAQLPSWFFGLIRIGNTHLSSSHQGVIKVMLIWQSGALYSPKDKKLLKMKKFKAALCSALSLITNPCP